VAPEPLTEADWAAELLTLAGLDAVITTSADRVLPPAGHRTCFEREMRSWMVHPSPHRCAGFATHRYTG
jgi:hypothetical protein